MRFSRRHLAFTVAVAALFVVTVAATHALFTTRVAGANDFYPRWVGARLFWQDGVDPYGEAATEAIQREMYGGRLARPDEDQVLFVYPFYTVFLLLPLTWLPLDYSWIQAIWLVTLQFSLVAAVFLTLRLVAWPRPPVWLLAGILLWAVLFYHNTRTIILGQFAGLIFLWLVGSLLALQRGRDGLAGALLALTTIKPQMSFLMIPALLLWGVARRRWRLVLGFGGCLGLLMGLSFLFLPGWLAGFWRQLTAYPGYTFTGSPLWVITGVYWPQLGRPVELALMGLLLGGMLAGWWRLWRLTEVTPAFLAIIGLTLVVTNMVVVRTATTNYIVMIMPLFLALRVVATRWPRGPAWVGVFLLASTVGLWWLFLGTISGDLESPAMYLPLPLGVLAMLAAGWRAGTWAEPA